MAPRQRDAGIVGHIDRAVRGQRVRLLHLVLDLEAGGLERLVADLVRRVDPARFETHLLAVDFLGRYADGLEAHATLHTAEPMSRWSMLWPAGLTRQLRRIAPQIVHTHSGVWYKGALAARKAGVPLIVHTDHGRRHPDPLSDRLQDRLASRWTDITVAVSERLRAQMRESVVAEGRRLLTISNGVDTDAFRPATDPRGARERLALPLGRPIIGSIGRLDPIKGYDVMLRAAGHLAAGWREGPAPLVAIAGDGEETERLRDMIRREDLTDHVRLLGWRDDLQELHAAFDIFTLASHSEGTSVSLLEAMSCGVCPVVTRVGGNPEVLGDALTHRLVEAGDPIALSAAWRDALLDAERRRADGAAARARVVAEFSLDVMVRRYESLYDAVPTVPLRPAAASQGGLAR